MNWICSEARRESEPYADSEQPDLYTTTLSVPSSAKPFSYASLVAACALNAAAESMLLTQHVSAAFFDVISPLARQSHISLKSSRALFGQKVTQLLSRS